MESAILHEDIDAAVRSVGPLWEDLRGGRLFITGGTGFFGGWLLDSFIEANERFSLDASAVVLTRNAERVSPHPSIQFHAGDVKTFDYPRGRFTHVIHAAATSAAETFGNADILDKFDTVVAGTRQVLRFAAHCWARKFLYTSSGVAYGKQSASLTHIPEGCAEAPETTDTATLAAWGSSKRAAEFLCAYHAERYGIEVKIARCFSFIGPRLPLDIHYAAGNFMQDALAGRPIQILGDGTPRRSYLYTSDLAAWLWTILLKGQSRRIYNVGSEEDVSIAELASLIAKNVPGAVVSIAKQPTGMAPDRYVPSTERARTELGLRQAVNLELAIERTLRFILGA